MLFDEEVGDEALAFPPGEGPVSAFAASWLNSRILPL